MINSRTSLHGVANGTMTGQRYIDEVLLPHVRLFHGARCDGITVKHGLEVSPRPKVARIEVGKSKRPSCGIPADDFVATEMS
ncbi:hypothetical protein TNCV_4260171 [Trichonephila clavipes]|nr:hypothetical protein TNCV_4260171 [Trichonephila clavipes]